MADSYPWLSKGQAANSDSSGPKHGSGLLGLLMRAPGNALNRVAEFTPSPVKTGLKAGTNVALDVADKPGQAVRAALTADYGKNPFQPITDAAKALVGKEHTTGTQVVSKALTGDKNKITKLPWGVDTLVSTGTDPTSYFTGFGAGDAAEAGLRAVAKVGGKDLAEHVVAGGALKTVERQAAKADLRRTLLTEGGAKTLKQADKGAEKAITAAERRGAGGATILGRSVPYMEADSTLGRAAKAANPVHLIGDKLQESELGRNIQGMFQRDAHLRPVADRPVIKELLNQIDNTGARVGHLQDVTDATARNVAKGVNMADPEIKRQVLQATDIASENAPLQAAKQGSSRAGKVVKSGEKIVASHDDKLVKTVQSQTEGLIKREAKTAADRSALEQEHLAKKSLLEDQFKTAQLRELAQRSVYQATASPEAKKAWLSAQKDLANVAQKHGDLITKGADKLASFDEKAATKAAEARATDAAKLHGMTVENNLLHDMQQGAVDRHVSSQINVAANANTPTQVAALRAAGHHRVADVVDLISSLRNKSTAAQQAVGLGKKYWDNFTGEYVPRYLTDEGRKALKENADKVAVTLGTPTKPVEKNVLDALLTSEGHTAARTLRPDLNISQINDLMREKGIMKEGQNFFNDNALEATVLRSHAADAAVEHAKMLDRIATDPTLVDKQGRQLLREVAPNYKPTAGEGELDLTGSVGKKYVADPAIVNTLNEAKAITHNDESLHWATLNAGKVATVWRGLATMGPAFHARNMAGNFWLNGLAGVWNPKYYEEAGALQSKLHGVYQQLGTDVSFGDALKAAGLTRRQQTILQGALDRGVIDRGFFHTDLPRAAVTGEKQGVAKRALTGVNQFNRQFGSAVENNARLAHYIAKLGTTGSADKAAESVKKYLFDYGSLTATERHKFKNIVPFYTFMRKNTPLELEALFNKPKQFSALAHVNSELDQRGVTYRPDFPVNNLQDVLDIGTSPTLQGKAQAISRPLNPFMKFPVEAASGHSSFNGYAFRNDKGVIGAAERSFIPPLAKVDAAKHVSPLQYLLGFKKATLPAPSASSSSKSDYSWLKK